MLIVLSDLEVKIDIINKRFVYKLIRFKVSKIVKMNYI